MSSSDAPSPSDTRSPSDAYPSAAPDGPQPFETLAERLRCGDQAALEPLWRQYGVELRRRARTRLRQYGVSGMAESMDVCNAVLLDLLRQGGIQLRQPRDLLPYISRAIDNQVRDVFRTLSRDRRDFRRNDVNRIETLNICSDDSSPSFSAIRAEMLQQIRGQLGDEGEIIVEMVLANHNWLEIGERLQLPPDTVRMRWRRAVERLQQSLDNVKETKP